MQRFFRNLVLWLLLALLNFSDSAEALPYPQMDEQAKKNISQILQQVQKFRKFSKEVQVQQLVHILKDRPYRFAWREANFKKMPGLPLFSSEHFDCVTYVQMILALLHSRDAKVFQDQILQIAFDLPPNKSTQLDYLNQNHFIDADWNRVNQKTGILKKNNLTGYEKKLSVLIDKENWLKMQKFPISKKMPQQKISINYLPKEKLLTYDGQKFIKNFSFYNFIKTPAIIEIIRDPAKWRKGRHLVRNLLGSETSVSHMGILYRKKFSQGELIYHKIVCQYGKSQCVVLPIYCQQRSCDELMLSHATISYPNGYRWQKKGKDYSCAAGKANSAATFCNRVENIPLYNYLTDLRDGYYNYMFDDSIVGFYFATI